MKTTFLADEQIKNIYQAVCEFFMMNSVMSIEDFNQICDENNSEVEDE